MRPELLFKVTCLATSITLAVTEVPLSEAVIVPCKVAEAVTTFLSLLATAAVKVKLGVTVTVSAALVTAPAPVKSIVGLLVVVVAVVVVVASAAETVDTAEAATGATAN